MPFDHGPPYPQAIIRQLKRMERQYRPDAVTLCDLSLEGEQSLVGEQEVDPTHSSWKIVPQGSPLLCLESFRSPSANNCIPASSESHLNATQICTDRGVRSDEEIVDAAMGELARLFPDEIAADERWPTTGSQGTRGTARLRKFAVVRVPRSVYAATPGRNKYRPSQQTPIRNFVLAGDFTAQKYLGSMEGAVLGGKLAAQVLLDRFQTGDDSHAHHATGSVKPVEEAVVIAAAQMEPTAPSGVLGRLPVAFGGGQQGGANTLHP
eukprot:6143478-Pleurochrysis_carterae.AAC.1